MTLSLAHRGPDDDGIYLGPGIGLGSRRLSILDLSERGHMPMMTPDGRYYIVYNGEIYNFQDLRADLEHRGVVFQSNTDTEVVLQLYAHDGPAMLDKLNGMFAIAIWDNETRTLFLARDRLGIKPLCYSQRHNALYFASEEKALLAAGIRPEFDPECWEELLYFRFVSGENTVFKHIKRLLPGHYALWQSGDFTIKRWWNLQERALAQRETHSADVVEWYQMLFDDSVKHRLISDVPLGVLLSGGLDSSSVAAALAHQLGGGISSFTVRFDEAGYDEGDIAREVADRWNLQFESISVSPEDEFFGLLQDASWFNDAPLAHGNDGHLLAISRYAKSRVTVLLSGEGGDETLGGYVRYRPLNYPQLINWGRFVLPPIASVLPLSNRWQKLARFMRQGDIRSLVQYNSADVLPVDLKDAGMNQHPQFAYRFAKLKEARELYTNDAVRQAMYVDQHTFIVSLLDRNDRMTMGASIECRVPFLDHRIIEGLAALPSASLIEKGQSKALLRHALGHRLPPKVLNFPKWGFGVPWSTYMRNSPQFADVIQQLPNHDITHNLPINRTYLKDMVGNFLAGDDQYIAIIKQIAFVAIWHNTLHKRLQKVEGVLS